MLLNNRYRVLDLVGEGGFGSVYKAADTSFGDRLVAIKVMEQKGLSPQEIAEAAAGFKQEALMLANLRHPHLPRIYDHFNDSGCWYLVMDYIEGESLDVYLQKSPCDPQTHKRHLSTTETLAIGLQLCTVLDYLHTRQPPIVFRDLKPANVMRTTEGHLYLIDFGIARHFKPGQIKDTMPLGSPGYAAPEQYGTGQTTPRADIYSLGVILHQLLTGNDPTARPFLLAPIQPGGDPALARAALLIKQMTEMDEAQRPTSLTDVELELRQVEDGQSDQRDQRVLRSLPPTASKGNPIVFNADQPSYAPEEPYASQSQQQQMFAQPSTEERQKQKKRPFRTVSRRKLLIGATTLVGVASVSLGTEWLALRGRSAPVSPASKQASIPSNPSEYTYTGHTGPVTSISLSPDGKQIASTSADKTIQLFNTATGSHIHTYMGHSDTVTGAGWSPDGLYIASTGMDSSIQQWESSTGKLLHILSPQSTNQTLLLQGPIYGGAWSTEVPRVATVIDGYLNLIDVPSWASMGGGAGPVVMATNAVSWAPNDPIIAVAQQDHSVYTWGINTEIGGARGIGHTRKVVALAWSPDGSKLVSGAQDNTVRVWSIPPLNVSATLDANSLLIYKGHTDWVQAVAWSPDGNKIASAGRDTTVQVWDASSGKLLYTFKGHAAPINSLAWIDGKTIASASDDKTVRVWRVL